MHTVIITDRQTTSLFARHRRLLEPFFIERGGSVCVCPWHEGGVNIEDAVPDLYKAIRGHPDWRAIILVYPARNDDERNDYEQKEKPAFDPRNPFDFVCNRGSELAIEENSAPLVRLTHMLAGFPSLGVKGYHMVYTIYDNEAGEFKDHTFSKSGQNIQLSKSHIDKAREEIKKIEEEIEKTEGDEKTKKNKQYERLKKIIDHYVDQHGGNIKPRLDEITYTEEEKAKHKKLALKYAFKENRPTEVLILSTREICTTDDNETTREEVRRAWQSYDEEESSDFWKVYPNTCRFICYDLRNPEHTLYSRDLWRFYLLALTLAVNQIPAPALQAYHLYKADLNINPDELKNVLDRHIENLMSVQAVIQERMLHIPEKKKEIKKELVRLQHISIKFESVDEGEVKANGDKFGLASDCPVSDTKFWREHIQGTRPTIDSILSAPQEIVAEKALETRITANNFFGIEREFDRFQLERIRKIKDELETRVINSNVYGILDSGAYKAEVAKAGDVVRKSIGLRLTKRNVLLVSSCSLLVYLCGFIPYFINCAKISRQVFGAALGLALIALVILAAGGVLTLWFLRRGLVKKIKTYNKTVMDIFDRVNKGARFFSEYFSSVCTYMHAYSLLTGVILKKDNDFTAVNILKAHLESLENEIEANKYLCSLYGVPVGDLSISGAFMDIKEEVLLKMPSKSRFYELTPNKDKGTLEIDNTGETLNAPYSFITGISLVREEIYDKKGE